MHIPVPGAIVLHNHRQHLILDAFLLHSTSMTQHEVFADSFHGFNDETVP
ncbi:hypothetical protein BGLCM_1098 [Bifidobacterium gallicum DSM 20093 = LMG 11596]|uniref:Uncharacterized protein n=1 Tax=Bifidobacterium gallicum DSM 20093 = LMG 11596 TaxID=561180 RepID=A0A087AJ54_9BIFI|nr:hypothetical protein BGLCM_1098 [Bifidobacterium gallicum DSM 20093 = LMG 11596]